MGSGSLVHEGWGLLRSGRPLAALACWRIAERVEGEREAARQALSALESAGDLPEIARKSPRLRAPESAEARARWDERLEGLDLDGASSREGLSALADAFGRLAADRPDDAAAWFNRAVGLAWLGANSEAVACLDRAVELEAGPAFERAVAAGTLAELLRQGRGAEHLADELSFIHLLDFGPAAAGGEGEILACLDEFPETRRLAAPRPPGEEAALASEKIVFEWLDRPVSEARAVDPEAGARGLPVVLAHGFWDRASGALRISSPLASALEQVDEVLVSSLPFAPRAARREAAPRPLAFLDFDVWMMRAPEALAADGSGGPARDWVEHYYENEWIHRPRHGLKGHSPLQAAEAARRGNAAMKARLEAVVAFREQLGARPSARGLYQGYPFDRLRRRLGLAPRDPNAIDPADLSCASAAELAALGPSTESDDGLASAMVSAAGLRDDALTAGFAAEWFSRGRPSIAGPDLVAVAAGLVRHALASRGADAALEWIERALRRAEGDGRAAAELGFWRGEVLARAGRGEEARAAFEARVGLGPPATAAATALRAAEFLLDQGHVEAARPLLEAARSRAEVSGRRGVARQARGLLQRHGQGES